MCNFNLTKPCKTCPFRNDRGTFLSHGRAVEIAEGLLSGQTFTCHKTIAHRRHEQCHSDKEEHCAGALIILEKMEQPNQMMRISERFGKYNRYKLDMGSPVYEDLWEWVGENE